MLRHNFVNAVYTAFFLFAATPYLTSPSSLHAQTAGEGTISGTVTDSTGAAIPNATVIAINKATNVASQRTSSSSGLFTIAPIPPGTYSLSVEATGSVRSSRTTSSSTPSASSPSIPSSPSARQPRPSSSPPRLPSSIPRTPPSASSWRTPPTPTSRCR